MARAIRLARQGFGFVSPNPMVGCVILDSSGRVLSEGYHAKCGEAHAEAMALGQIKDSSRLKGAHVIVTLEPCAHEGRTPSCAKALAKTSIGKVTYGLTDPNPQVSGKGCEILKAAGIQVEKFKSLQLELEEICEAFLVNQRKGRPFYACKVATSLDGQTALGNGESQWITNPRARKMGQWLRGGYDAVLTGSGTIMADNPQLNCRFDRFKDKPQNLVVLDPKGRILENFLKFRFQEIRPPESILLITAKSGLKAPKGVRLAVLPQLQGVFNSSDLHKILLENSIFSVYVEAGAFTIGEFLNNSLVDRLYLFLGNQILGQGQSWSKSLNLKSLDQAPVAKSIRYRAVGDNVFASARLWS